MRANTCTIIIGRRATGKTTLTNRVIEASDKPVLIVDASAQPAYQKFPMIAPEEWKDGWTGIRRVYKADMDSVLKTMAKYLHNCMIVYEDAYKYIPSSVMPKPVNDFLIDLRHRNVDVIFVYHSLRRVPPILFEMTNYITLFKTNDIIDSSQSKIPNFNAVKRAWESVTADRNEHAHITIDTGI